MTARYYDMASGSAMYYSRKILEEMGYFDEEYVLWEDGPFLAKYLYKYSLTFAYDILSIWYEKGGVSSSQKIHPLLAADAVKFNMTTRLLHIDEFNNFDRRKVLYASLNINNLRDSIIKKVTFFPQFVSSVFMKVARILRKTRDVHYIKQYMDKCMGKIIFKN